MIKKDLRPADPPFHRIQQLDVPCWKGLLPPVLDYESDGVTLAITERGKT
jgi:hypothetical protein